MLWFLAGMITTSFFVSGCSANNTPELQEVGFPILNGTRWECDNEISGTDFMIFDKVPARNYWGNLNVYSHVYRDEIGSYSYYIKELESYTTGTYEVVGDTLILTEIGLVNEMTYETEVKAYIKLVRRGDGLQAVHYMQKHDQVWRGGPTVNPGIFEISESWID